MEKRLKKQALLLEWLLLSYVHPVANFVPTQAHIFVYINGKTYMYNDFLKKPTTTQKFHKISHSLFMIPPTLHKNLVCRYNRKLL
jgi:hypothetical protein